MILRLAAPTMVKKGKWLRSTQPGDPVSSAAREALDTRLALVEHYLRPAAREGDEESVHQLRVATRRATAAIDTYRDVLPEERARWIRKRLKRLRRAAGDARDYDVLLKRLKHDRAEQPLATAWPMLIERVIDLRDAAQQPIREIRSKLKDQKFAKRSKSLTKHIAWDCSQAEEPTFAQAAQAKLTSTLDRFFEAAKGEMSDIEKLHEFRIEGKRLRYAMELFASVFPPSFKSDLYPQIEELQEKLGAVNDHASAAERFARWRTTWEDAGTAELLDQLAETSRRAADAAQREFLAWWTPERCDDLRRQFTAALSASAAEQVA